MRLISLTLSNGARTCAVALALLNAGPALEWAQAAGGRYGEVTFANSGAAAAQADFLEGLSLLHNFEYPHAAAAFRRAEAADPGFAMAYWGEAMTFNHPVWMQQDLAAARAALSKLAASPAERRAKAKTDREKAYLDAVEILYGDGGKFERDFRYEQAMAKVHERYPDDIDAAAFYGLAILGTAHAGRDTPTYMRAASVLEEAWVDHREHPGLVHYLIHCYDDPAHAALGLRTARLYGRIAPDAPHALHMTSHIFLALGMWPETVEANLAAIAAVNHRREAVGRPPVHWGHYSTWLAYAYLQLGKADEARALLTACRADLEAQAAPDRSETALDPDESISGSLANLRLRYLVDTGDWQSQPAGWPVPKQAGPRGQFDWILADTLAQIALGHSAEARTALTGLENAGRKLAAAAAQEANPDPTERGRAEILLLEARALLSELEGDLASAEKLLRRAVEQEEALPIAYGPPSIEKPTHELFAQFLLRRGRKGEAGTQFAKALLRTPGRKVAREGFVAASAGARLPTALEAGDQGSAHGVRQNDPVCGLAGYNF